ncbi:hypothetical protein P879_11867 [Paragonimus westermani]|uniref:Uncharacterized protein n=1 Tax=Paragonimus westermani TaxID=34504 RepID=A0A8T0D7E4_9TREM|nr:hypothetical protein P879_11867 [Paragonimus westermani]
MLYKVRNSNRLPETTKSLHYICQLQIPIHLFIGCIIVFYMCTPVPTLSFVTVVRTSTSEECCPLRAVDAILVFVCDYRWNL